ncbi:unnamed protein product [Adineta ricciae]|uniref:G-protein coupled receptors family 1 profile domain-containing protein n=1 Tax=Adineta ricciae TaxID=249248 RepID=A0A815BCS2_ADIRI|nr:unnamed protein product [Adineta ricciae]
MASFLVSTLAFAQIILVQYVETIFFVLGTIGSILNILLFSQQKFRSNSCSIYFLASSIATLILLFPGVIPQVYALTNSPNPVFNQAFCRARSYLTQMSAMLCRWLLTVACIDRCLLTFTNPHLRHLATVPIARKIVLLLVIMWLLIPIHILIFADVRRIGYILCTMATDASAIYHTIYTILAGGVFPPLIMLICTRVLWKSLQAKRQRQELTQIRQKKREIRDVQILAMLLLQVFIFILFTLPYMMFNLYLVFTRYVTNKSADRLAIEAFLQLFTEITMFAYLSTTFYSNTLVSQTFRNELITLITCNHGQKFCKKRRIAPHNLTSSTIYPPLDRPGPSYTVPRRNLSQSLVCYAGTNYHKRWILFLPGSTEEVHELYSWNWMNIMKKRHWPFCTLQLPENGLGDLQIAAEYIVHSVRKLHRRAVREKKKGIRSKTRIHIIGHSLGGALPRFALRFWPDIRSMVYQLIAFGATNHGTSMADTACQAFRCPISVTQQRINSSFLCAMNSYQESFSSIRYINILSKFDEIVRPVESSEIHGETVTNIYIQDICPLRIFSEHLGAGIYDYCGYFLTMNALNSRSLKNISKEECCSQILMPGIDTPTTEFLSKVLYSAEEHARQLLMHFGEIKDEPELRCVFRMDCLTRKKRVKQMRLR